ncbi:MAG: LysR family transcriptional regulator [Alphaproteobacteria bacterium]|nr:MAG: LysR family transcriptional regulator [Alphaproteobacteria bacterium]
MMRLNALTLKQLRCLVAVAERRSLSAAAAALNQTTPAIHSQIRNLEDAAGVALLARAADGSGFDLTVEGTELLRAAHRIEANLSQAAAAMAAIARGRRGRVVLGVVSTAKYFAPRLVRRLLDLEPEIDVVMRVGNRDRVAAELAHGAVNLAIMGRPPRQPEVQVSPLGPHPHGVILPPDHPLAREDGFDPLRLLSETFLSREEGSGTRVLMMRFFDRLAEGHPVRLIEMESNETIKQAVLAGLGLAFLSLHTVCDELTAGRLALLRGPGLPVMRHWYLVLPAWSEPAPATSAIATAIEGLNGTYLPTAACLSQAA